MRKTLISGIVILLIAGLVVVAPYFTGIRAEQSIRNILTWVSEQNPGTEYKISDYHRGWFSSDAVIVFKFAAKPDAYVNVELEKKVHISHGPVIISKSGVQFGLARMAGTIKAHGELEKLFKKMLPEGSAQLPELETVTLVGFTESFETAATIPAVSLHDPNNADNAFTWGGMTLKASANGDKTKTDMSWTVGPVEATNKKETVFKSAPFTFHGSIQNQLNSEIDFDLPSFSGVSPDGKFSLEKLNFYAKTTATDKVVNANFSMSVGKFIPIEEKHQFYSGSIAINLKNLNFQALKDLADQAKVFQKPSMTELEQTQAGMALIMILPRIVSSGPELSIQQFKIVTPKGEGTLTGKMSIPATENPNPLSIMQSAEVELNLSIPQDMAMDFLTDMNLNRLTKQGDEVVEATDALHEQAKKEADEQYQKWQADQYMKVENNQVSVKLTFSKGELQLNGKKVQLNQ